MRMGPAPSPWAEIRQEVDRVTAGREWRPAARTLLHAAAVMTRIDHQTDWATRFEQAFQAATRAATYTGYPVASEAYELVLVRELRGRLGLSGK
jgi:hypothetical protein